MKNFHYLCAKIILYYIYMSKVTDIKARHPEMILDLVEMFAKHDPSNTNKYLEYMVKIASVHVKSEEFIKGIEDCFSDIFEIVGKFDNFVDSPIIKNKDIYSYEINDLIKVIEEAEKHKTDKHIKERETIHLYRDDNFNVLIPLTYDSSRIYGSTTKWCTTTKDSPSQFISHTNSGVLVYVINKKDNVPSKYQKVAWYIQGKDQSFKYGDSVSIWDNEDRQIKGFTEVFELMNKHIDKPVRDILMNLTSLVEEHNYTTSKNQNELKAL